MQNIAVRVIISLWQFICSASACPLARVISRELKKCGIEKCKVVYSKEEPAKSSGVPASWAYVPSVAGLSIAGEAVKHLIK